jgi:MoxR-like ATPase
MVYSGFEERLVITPFTDKCYVAIWNAMRNNVIPILKGHPGCNKASVARESAVVLGADYTVCNCDTVSRMEDLLGHIQAGIGCGMMIIFNNIEKLIWRYILYVLP